MKERKNLRCVSTKKLFKLKIIKIESDDFLLNEKFKVKKCLKDFDILNGFRIENVFLDDIKIYTENNKIYLNYGIMKDRVLGKFKYENGSSNKIIVYFRPYGKIAITFKTS